MQDRRMWCKRVGILFGSVSVVGCGGSGHFDLKPPEHQYTDEERARIHKFRGIRGYESALSGFGKTWKDGVYAEVRNESGRYYANGNFWAYKDSKPGRSFPALGPPKFLRVRLLDPVDSKHIGKTSNGESIISGTVFGEWDVPIAERIPDDLLNDLRATPKGSLRIKLRFHREGVLLGWDIQRRPGFDPQVRDEFGEARYVAPVHSFAGGDFREARIFNGKPIRMGWHIHPRTKQRIETDF